MQGSDSTIRNSRKLSTGSLQQHKREDSNNGQLQFHCPMEPCHLNIVFIGDSLTRYAYMSLVHFLRFNNTWIEPTEHPNMVIAQTYLNDVEETQTDWTSFYEQTMAKLSPYENCDCFRGPRRKPRTPITENRYFYDPIRNNTITYIQAFGHKPIHGHWLDPVKAAREPLRVLQRGTTITMNQSDLALAVPNSSQTEIPLLGPMPAVLPPLWIGGWDYVIESHISQIRPEVLVMNAGKWKNQFHRPRARLQLLQATQRVGIPRVIWRTTTSDSNGQYAPEEKLVDDGMCQIMECFNVTEWIHLLPSSFYHDWIHFKEPVYRFMNEELFSLLGAPIPSPPPLPWTKLNISDEWIAEKHTTGITNT